MIGDCAHRRHESRARPMQTERHRFRERLV